MVKTLAICEKETSKQHLSQLLNKVRIDKVFTIEECRKICLDEFKVLFFILNIESIGNEFFLSDIDKILNTRKSSKSIYFIIDEITNLNKSELFNIKLELEKSLMNKIKYPQIIPVALVQAASYYAYKIQMMNLDDIRKEKSISFIDDDGYNICGRQLNEEHVLRFWDESNVKELIRIIEDDVPQFENIDTRKKTWGVFGNKGSGKTTFSEVISNIKENMNLIECIKLKEIKYASMEGVIILLTLNHEENRKVLDVVKRLNNIDVIILINKIDTFTDVDKSKKEIIQEINNYTREITKFEVTAAISSYYSLKEIKLNENEINIKDLINDKEIIILDKYGFPEIYNGDEKRFKENFVSQSTLNIIKGVEF